MQSTVQVNRCWKKITIEIGKCKKRASIEILKNFMLIELKVFLKQSDKKALTNSCTNLFKELPNLKEVKVAYDEQKLLMLCKLTDQGDPFKKEKYLINLLNSGNMPEENIGFLKDLINHFTMKVNSELLLID